MNTLLLAAQVVLAGGTFTDYQIVGSVHDIGSGEPLAAYVGVYDQDGNSLATGESAKDGQFSFVVPSSSDAPVVVRASAAAYHAASRNGDLSALGTTRSDLEPMAVCREATAPQPPPQEIGPFNDVLREPSLPGNRLISGAVLSRLMEYLSLDLTGHVVPLLNSASCRANGDGYLSSCSNVSESIPLSPPVTTIVPVSTYARVEAYPVERCRPISDYLQPLEIHVTLRAGEKTNHETIAVVLGYPHWTPAVLSEQLSLGADEWASSVTIDVTASRWDHRLPAGCNLDLRLWPNHPNQNVAEARALLTNLTEEAEFKGRMLDYAQAVVSFAPALRLIEEQMTMILSALATSADERLRDSCGDMITALEEAMAAVDDVASRLDQDPAATQNAIYALIAVLSQIDAGGSWTDEEGRPLTVRALLDEDDAAYVASFAAVAGELAAQAEYDVATIPTELAELKATHAVAQELLTDRVLERPTHGLWDTTHVTVEGKIRVVGTSAFPRTLLVAADSAATLMSSPVTDELSRLQSATVLVRGSWHDDRIDPVAYQILDVTGGPPELVGNVEIADDSNLRVRTCDGAVVRLDYQRGSLFRRIGSLVWMSGKWTASDRFDPSRYGVLRAQP